MSEYAHSVPPHLSADLEILRRSDPALVASGLAALYRRETVLVASILTEIGIDTPTDLPGIDTATPQISFVETVRSTIGYKVSPDGEISGVESDDLTKRVRSATSITVGVPLGNGSPDQTEGAGRSAGFGMLVSWLRDALANGLRLELAPRVGPTMNFSVPSIQALPNQLPPRPRRDGRGVVIGVIDWGCDFPHPAFCHPNGSTRLRYLWDQNSPPTGRSGQVGPAGLGRLFDAREINFALRTPDPYWTLDYSPTSNPFAPLVDGAVVHGTHVMGVAAGNRAEHLSPGVAPAADLIFIHLPPKGVPTSLDTSGGGSLLLAVLWLFAKVGRKPAVANLSLGTNSGPHDGTSVLELAFDWILKQPGRAIVLPAGNSFRENLHASGTIPTGGEVTLTWKFKWGDPTANALDVWYETDTAAPLLTINLTAPDRSVLTQPQPGDPMLITRFNRLVGIVTTGVRSNRAGKPFLQQIHIELWSVRVDAEDWTIQLRLPAGPEPVSFNAWIDRDDLTSQTQSSFAPHEADHSRTLASLSCGESTLCVGTYYEIPRGQPIMAFSGSGPTRDGRLKPDIAAPGWRVLAANAFGGPLQQPGSTNQYPLVAAMDGTSVSVPHVTGLVALLLQERPASTAAEVSDLIRSWTQLIQPTFAPPTPTVPPRNWDPRVGYGRIDAAASLWHQP